MAIEERQADNRARMTSLASQFPVLKDAPGITPWDPQRLDEWASGGASHSECHAAAFVLHVWNPHYDWKAGRFDVMAALWVWDAENRRPFVEWATTPRWE